MAVSVGIEPTSMRDSHYTEFFRYPPLYYETWLQKLISLVSDSRLYDDECVFVFSTNTAKLHHPAVAV